MAQNYLLDGTACLTRDLIITYITADVIIACPDGLPGNNKTHNVKVNFHDVLFFKIYYTMKLLT